MKLGRKKKAKPSCGWNESLSCSTKTFHFQGMQYPGLCLEQVCLLKYLTCHTCVSWIQSCGIILVPVHTSCSYPQRYPVTPCTGGAALHSMQSPLPHDFLETDSNPATAASEHLCSGAWTNSGTSKRPPPRARTRHCQEKWTEDSKYSFLSLLCVYYQQILYWFMPNRHSEDLR